MGFARVIVGLGLSALLAQGVLAGELALGGEANQSTVEFQKPLGISDNKVTSSDVTHVARSLACN